MKTEVAVVVPNWNGADLIAGCLGSLRSLSYGAKIIVVDNGSADESVPLIEEHFPEVTLIKLPENAGFTGGVNAGISYAIEHGFDAVALFNNDAVAEKSWLGELVKAMESDKRLGIVTSKLMRTDKKHFDSTGDQYSIWGMPFPRARNLEDTGQFDEPEEVFSASGGASLYRCTMLKEIGLFDQKFFAYLEDVDISFRARLAGWKILYQPKAVAYHHVSATSSKLGSFSNYHFIKNFLMTYTKNMPGWLFWKYLPLFLVQAARLAVTNTLRGVGLAYFRGLGRFLLNLPAVLRDRRRIQGSRKVSLDQIEKLLYMGRPPRIPRL